jgi:hypothetical protein
VDKLTRNEWPRLLQVIVSNHIGQHIFFSAEDDMFYYHKRQYNAFNFLWKGLSPTNKSAIVQKSHDQRILAGLQHKRFHQKWRFPSDYRLPALLRRSSIIHWNTVLDNYSNMPCEIEGLEQYREYQEVSRRLKKFYLALGWDVMSMPIVNFEVREKSYKATSETGLYYLGGDLSTLYVTLFENAL